ncbi:MAG: hypothetical protein WD989_02240, partial [Candidatus Paceibacterota bacterium]
SNSRFIVLETGNVGIGTTGPSDKLHVSGGRVRFDQSDNADILLVGTGQSADNKIWSFQQSGLFLNGRIVNDAEGASANWLQVERSGTTVTDVSFPNGNVGIGTTGPGEKLEVVGRVKSTGSAAAWASINGMEFNDNSSEANSRRWAILTGSSVLGSLDFRVGTTQTGDPWSGGLSKMIISKEGNVGIGTTGPTGLLEVNGNLTGSTGALFRVASGSTELFRIQENGNVGIGTTTPVRRLHVKGTGDDEVAVFEDFNSTQKWSIFMDNSDFTVRDFTASASYLTILNASGNVGIGSTSPTQKLVVTGTAGANDVFNVASSSGTSILFVSKGGNVGIGTTSNFQTKFEVLGTASISGTTTFGSGTGKITVGTIDPVYTIGGERYATYMAGMIGIKEEVTGVVDAQEKVEGVGYKYVIDFKTLPPASDLWLFSRTTDIVKHINQMSVLLTPQGNARAWYVIDPSNYTLTIYSSKQTKVSFRLTAPRFDAEKWTNFSTDEVTGFMPGDMEFPVSSGSADIVVVSEGFDFDIDILFEAIVARFGEILEIVFKKGLIKVAEIVTDKFTTKQLCIEDVCVGKDQLQAILNQNGTNLLQSTPTPNSENDLTTTEITNTASLSEELTTSDIGATASGSEETITIEEITTEESPSPTPEPEPSEFPTPEPTPEQSPAPEPAPES